MVVMCNNARCYRGLDPLREFPAAFIRLRPYSLILNPYGPDGSRMVVNQDPHEIPVVDGTGVGEQRLTYLQNLVNDAKATVTNSDCARSVQHSSVFHVAIIAL